MFVTFLFFVSDNFQAGLDKRIQVRINPDNPLKLTFSSTPNAKMQANIMTKQSGTEDEFILPQ